MKKEQVQIGDTYMAKVTNRVVEVRIDRVNPRGGWDATSLSTYKKIRVRDARRLSELRGGGQVVEEDEIQEPEMEVPEVEVAEEPAAEPEAPVAEPEAPLEPETTVEPVVTEEMPQRGGERSPRSVPMVPATPAVAPRPHKPAKSMGCLDAAAEVLKDAGTPMRCQEMITAMKEQGLWTSNAPTPHATLYSAILREITTKGTASRFTKTERGQFTLRA